MNYIILTAEYELDNILQIRNQYLMFAIIDIASQRTQCAVTKLWRRCPNKRTSIQKLKLIAFAPQENLSSLFND